jgi:predicted ATPase
MNKITKPALREIIEDFACEIKQRKELTPAPNEIVIDFRDEIKNRKARKIYEVPIELLRYRKNNGRISSDVLDYEKNHALLDEKTREAQKIIRDFLERKDIEKTKDLKNQILHKGQLEPAIITCDGFLINGNRRKMVMEILNITPEHINKFLFMKVVILPGKDDEGGPPTLYEIEKIENRYQYQSTGKAEYYGFDRALSMRRKIDLGMPLEEQLRDDPRYAHLSKREFENEKRREEEEYLKPLECVDRYLAHLGREGLYGTVSTGMADREGRWQAFIDYYQHVYKKLENEKERINLKIEEDEIGKIEDAAFKIIRKRDLSNLGKVHKVMRDLSKYLKNDESKKELFKLNKIDLTLERKESIDVDGNEYDERTLDNIWGKKYANDILRRVNRVKETYEIQRELETPLELLKAALKKLNHENMDATRLPISDLSEARMLAFKIKKRADELESEFFHCEKDIKKDVKLLAQKHKKH